MVNRDMGGGRPVYRPGDAPQRFVYRGRTAQQIRERASRRGGSFDTPFRDGFDTWIPKAGDNLIRFCPPTWDGHDDIGLVIWCHSYIGVDESTYLCPDKTYGQPCPICLAAKHAKDAGDDEEFKRLKVKERIVYWIIDRDGDQRHPLLYNQGWMYGRDLNTLCINDRTGAVLPIEDPYVGFDVSVKRTGTKLTTRYMNIIERDSTPLHPDPRIQDDIINYVMDNPLQSVLKVYPYEYLERVISGTVVPVDPDMRAPPAHVERGYPRDGDGRVPPPDRGYREPTPLYGGAYEGETADPRGREPAQPQQGGGYGGAYYGEEERVPMARVEPDRPRRQESAYPQQEARAPTPDQYRREPYPQPQADPRYEPRQYPPQERGQVAGYDPRAQYEPRREPPAQEYGQSSSYRYEQERPDPYRHGDPPTQDRGGPDVPWQEERRVDPVQGGSRYTPDREPPPRQEPGRPQYEEQFVARPRREPPPPATQGYEQPPAQRSTGRLDAMRGQEAPMERVRPTR